MTEQGTLSADDVVRELATRGFGPAIGVPCSSMAALILCWERAGADVYTVANNEGEAVAIAAGATLAGQRPVVLLQNSGLGNAVNPLTSLCQPLQIPMLLLVAWRGRPGRSDEPQHRLMGRITEPMLDLMEIEHDVLSTAPGALEHQLDAAADQMDRTRLPQALVVPVDALAAAPAVGRPTEEGPPSRREVIGTVMRELHPDVVVVATTGKTARELAADWDRPANLYTVGSMGCASSIALGVALHRPHRRVVVLDGDGAALMRLEAMVSIGARSPSNLVHIVLDNQSYESTGGQRSLSTAVDFPAVARGCGYRTARTVAGTALHDHVRSALAADGPHLLAVRIATGSDPGLGRPALGPAEAAERLRRTLAATPLDSAPIDR